MTTETEYRALLEQAIDELLPISHNSTDDPRGQADKAIALIRAELAKPSPTPAWHDAPTCPGLWVLDDGTALVLESGTLPKAFDGLRWYGPIPEDAKAEEKNHERP